MPEHMLEKLLEPPRPHRASMGLPMVTFVMPTYGRAARQPAVINESVYWVTRTTYPNWELLIINDCPEQELKTETPGVRVVNWPYRFKSLGQKMNLGTILAAGSIIMVNEDDDISLPWRAKQAAEALKDYDYWCPALWWFEVKGFPFEADGNGVGHNCAAYRRYALLNRYPHLTKGHDAAAHEYALKYTKASPHHLDPTKVEEISYVYRWGVSDFHLSGQSDMEGAYDHADAGPPGVYEVKPEMGVDYLALHTEAALKLKGMT